MTARLIVDVNLNSGRVLVRLSIHKLTHIALVAEGTEQEKREDQHRISPQRWRHDLRESAAQTLVM
jgi:hypothetical protein